jgi:hypothetical protein
LYHPVQNIYDAVVARPYGGPPDLQPWPCPAAPRAHEEVLSSIPVLYLRYYKRGIRPSHTRPPQHYTTVHKSYSEVQLLRTLFTLLAGNSKNNTIKKAPRHPLKRLTTHLTDRAVSGYNGALVQKSSEQIEECTSKDRYCQSYNNKF